MVDGKICSVDDCSRAANSRGWCTTHYSRWRIHGSVNPEGMQKRFKDPEKSFLHRTRWEGDCLVWTGSKWGSGGYGRMTIKGRGVSAHRYAWERVNGPIPEGKIIDHTCFNPACCNVEHLRLCTTPLNNQNKSGSSISSSTGLRGVHFHKRDRRWVAKVVVSGVAHYEYFSTMEDAAEAVSRMRAELMPFSQT